MNIKEMRMLGHNRRYLELDYKQGKQLLNFYGYSIGNDKYHMVNGSDTAFYNSNCGYWIWIL